MTCRKSTTMKRKPTKKDTLSNTHFTVLLSIIALRILEIKSSTLFTSAIISIGFFQLALTSRLRTMELAFLN